MKCPNCGNDMEEVNKWQMAPFGGWLCTSCGLKISKKSSSRCMRFKCIWK